MARNLEISTAYARLILRSEWLTPAAALAGTGIVEADLEREEFIPWEILATMFDNLEQALSGRAWAPALGALFNVNSHGPLGFAALSAPTLGAALSALGSLYPARNSAMRIEQDEAERRYFLFLDDLTGDPLFGERMAQVVMRIAESLLSTILGHPVGHNVEVRFTGPPPADLETFTATYAGRVIFGAPRASISLPITWCALPSPLHDEVTYRLNILRCREIIASREQGGSTAWSVSNLLSNHFDQLIRGVQPPGPPPTLAGIAEQMHMTERTLIRRLRAEGTSYRDIIEQQRQELAGALLGNAGLRVAEVGELLGYREPANFGRAFRRWHGCSPARWRRDH